MYNIAKRLIELGRTDGLAKRIDLLYTIGKLTDEEYKELIELLNNQLNN